MAAAAMALSAWLVHRATGQLAAAAVILLNPFVILSVVNGGHNDALVGLALLGMVLCVRKGWAGAAGGLLAAGALIKLSTLLAGIPLVLWLLRRRGLKAAVAAGVVAVVLTGAGTAIAGGRVATKPLSDASLRVTKGSVWSEMRRRLIQEDRPRPEDATRDMRQVRQLAAVSVFAAALLFAAARSRDRDPALAVTLAVFAYCVLGTYVQPWYIIWAVPVGAIAWRSRSLMLLLAYAAVLDIAYVPDFRPYSVLKFGPQTVTQALQGGLRGVVVPIVTAALAVALALAAVRRLRLPEPAADMI
jgi:hypothetical protein